MRRGFASIQDDSSDDKGANLVEAAIITPLLLLLTLAIVDFSAMFYAYLALEHGVSQATRFAVTGQELDHLGGAAIEPRGIDQGQRCARRRRR